ncbi:ATP-binding cassette domain-containing protein [Gordonia sp. WA4-43]|nr:ATP-binding cassette domain-containing protein [Gordonia sp. WA4-43]
MSWIPDEDPTLRQLRAWRAELDALGEPSAPPDPVASADPEVSADPEASADPGAPAGPEVSAGKVNGVPLSGRDSLTPSDDRPMGFGARKDMPARPQPRRTRHRKPDDGLEPHRQHDRASQRHPNAWVIPGIGWTPTGESTIEEPLDDGSGPPIPYVGRVGWDVTGLHEPPAKRPEMMVGMSAEPMAQSQAGAVSSSSLEPVSAVEVGEITEIAIEAVGLRKSFKDFVAVDGVSFRVPKGSIVALLGPNGAGKTTTVNMLCTLLKPDDGTAMVAGHDVVKDAAGVRRSVMLTGQFAALDEGLTGRENLIMFGRLLGLRKKAAKTRADVLLETFGLEEAANRKVGKYSGGMRRRIDVACGLVTEPEVVFLDEPTTGLDPRSRQDVWTLVERLRDSGTTVLLTTQYLEEADRLSDNVVVIDHGRVIAEGSSDELKAQIGSAFCEITPVHPASLPRLRAELADVVGLQVTEVNDRISVPAPNGVETLAQVIAASKAADIPLADISLRRPSLDEVFMSLTGGNRR